MSAYTKEEDIFFSTFFVVISKNSWTSTLVVEVDNEAYILKKQDCCSNHFVSTEIKLSANKTHKYRYIRKGITSDSKGKWKEVRELNVNFDFYFDVDESQVYKLEEMFLLHLSHFILKKCISKDFLGEAVMECSNLFHSIPKDFNKKKLKNLLVKEWKEQRSEISRIIILTLLHAHFKSDLTSLSTSISDGIKTSRETIEMVQGVRDTFIKKAVSHFLSLLFKQESKHSFDWMESIDQFSQYIDICQCIARSVTSKKPKEAVLIDQFKASVKKILSLKDHPRIIEYVILSLHDVTSLMEVNIFLLSLQKKIPSLCQEIIKQLNEINEKKFMEIVFSDDDEMREILETVVVNRLYHNKLNKFGTFILEHNLFDRNELLIKLNPVFKDSKVMWKSSELEKLILARIGSFTHKNELCTLLDSFLRNNLKFKPSVAEAIGIFDEWIELLYRFKFISISKNLLKILWDYLDKHFKYEQLLREVIKSKVKKNMEYELFNQFKDKLQPSSMSVAKKTLDLISSIKGELNQNLQTLFAIHLIDAIPPSFNFQSGDRGKILINILSEHLFWKFLLDWKETRIVEHKCVKEVSKIINNMITNIKNKTIIVSTLTDIFRYKSQFLSLASVKCNMEKELEQSENQYNFYVVTLKKVREYLDIFCSKAKDKSFFFVRLEALENSFMKKSLMQLFDGNDLEIFNPIMDAATKIFEFKGHLKSFRNIFDKFETQDLNVTSITSIVNQALDSHKKNLEESVAKDAKVATFEQLYNKIEESEIKIELDILESVYQVDIPSLYYDYCRSYLRIFDTLKIIENLEKCLVYWNCKLDQNLSQFILLLSQGNYLSQTMDNVHGLMKTVLSFTEYIGDLDSTIHEIASSPELINFLIKTLNDDFRVLIDAVEEHSDNYIREDTVSFLIDLQSYIKIISTQKFSNSKDFIHLLKQIPAGKKGKIDAKINVCSANYHGLKRLYGSVSNRGEVTKEIIENIVRNGTLSFKQESGKYFVKVSYVNAQKNNSSYSMTELLELKSRALLIMNTDSIVDGSEKRKKIMYSFVEIVDAIQCLLDSAQDLLESGYPESFSFELQGIDEINKKNEYLTNVLQDWYSLIKNIRKKYPSTYFFTAHQLFALEEYFKGNQSKKFKDLLHISFNKPIPQKLDGNLARSTSDVSSRLEFVGSRLKSLEYIQKLTLFQLKFSIESINISHEKLIIALAPEKSRALNVVFYLYGTMGYYPRSDCIMMCKKTTTWEEILLIFKRSQRFPKLLHCLINIDNLIFEIRAKAIQYIQKKIINKGVSFAVISAESKNQSLAGDFRDNVIRTNGLDAKEILQTIQFDKSIYFIHSNLCGSGKTEFIKDECHKRGLGIVSFPINGPISYDTLLNRIMNTKLENWNALHLDLSMVDDFHVLNEFLFELLFLKTLNNGKYVYRLECKAVYVEIGNTLNNTLLDGIPIMSWYPCIEIMSRIENLKVSNKPESPIQLVCTYLDALDRGIIDSSNIERSALNTARCRFLLSKYFSGGIEDMTYTILNIFLKVVSVQLSYFSNSYLLKAEVLESMMGKNTVRSELLKALLNVSTEYTNRSVAAKTTQREELTDAMIQRTINMNLWSNSNHLIIMFNALQPQTISALYRDKTKISEEFVRLFETQKIQLEDFTEMSEKNLFAKLQILCSTKLSITHNQNYAITCDNLLKMALIFSRIRARIPVIIMGETGCGKTSLIRYLAGTVGAEFRMLGFHAGITEDMIIDFVNRVSMEANQATIWVFLDEINTCPHIELLSEILCHKTMFGKPLPLQVTFLAACNPYRRLKQKVESAGISFKQEKLPLAYKVLPLPEPMIDYIWDYGSLSPKDEAKYIRTVVANMKYSNLISELLCSSQEFLKRNIDECTVSLRDVTRCKKLIEWFKMYLGKKPSRHCDLAIKNIDQQAIVLALAHCYYARLPYSKLRSEYRATLADIFLKNNIYINQETISTYIKFEQEELVSRMELPYGIAMNTMLLENIFVILVCILNRMPIFVVGHPGCSKSLSMQLINSNLRGRDSKDKYFQTLPQVYIIAYQGSESSTSEGIQKVFEKAERYLEHNKGNDVIPVVLLDEVGLAEQSKYNPLKILHYLLEKDEQKIAVVGISNWALDAAKMNRAIHLARPPPDLEDLVDTAFAIQKAHGIQEISHSSAQAIKSIAMAYTSYSDSQPYSNFHGLRDYYSLIKSLSKNNSFDNPESVCKTLERNFGGIPRNYLDAIQTKFLTELRNYEFKPILANSLDLIEENLGDKEARHLMLITNSDSAISLLETTLASLKRNPIIIMGSKFPDDQNEQYSYRILSKIILCMESGQCVILKDLEQVYGSLYDMLNQNYSVVGKKKNCRIALGAYSNPMCHVHDDFRCVILAENSKINYSDPPFLNRFEKQILVFNDVLSGRHHEIIKQLKVITKDLVTLTTNDTQFKEEDLFVGMNTDTLSSLVLLHAKEGLTDENIIENCLRSLLLISNVDGIIRANISALKQKDYSRFQQIMNIYYESDRYNLEACIKSELSAKPEEGLKLVISTFSNNLELIDNFNSYTECLGSFTSEKHLATWIEGYFKSTNQMLILHCDSNSDKENILLAKFLLDQAYDNYYTSNVGKKHMIIIYHTYKRIYENEEGSPFNFLSGWKLIHVDRLNGLKIDLESLMKTDILDILENETSIYPFFNALSDILMWCFLCIKYPPHKELIKELQNLKGNILKNDDLVQSFKFRIINWMKKNLSTEEYDWKTVVMCNSKRVLQSTSVVSSIMNYIQDTIRKPAAMLIHCAVKCGALETFFRCSQELKIFWIQIFQNTTLIDISTYAPPRGANCYSYDIVNGLEFPFSFLAFKEIQNYKTVFEENLSELMMQENNVDEFGELLPTALNNQTKRFISIFTSNLPHFSQEINTYNHIFLRDILRLYSLQLNMSSDTLKTLLNEIVSFEKSAFEIIIHIWRNEKKILQIAKIIEISSPFVEFDEFPLMQEMVSFFSTKLLPKQKLIEKCKGWHNWSRNSNRILMLVQHITDNLTIEFHFVKLLVDIVSNCESDELDFIYDVVWKFEESPEITSVSFLESLRKLIVQYIPSRMNIILVSAFNRILSTDDVDCSTIEYISKSLAISPKITPSFSTVIYRIVMTYIDASNIIEGDTPEMIQKIDSILCSQEVSTEFLSLLHHNIYNIHMKDDISEDIDETAETFKLCVKILFSDPPYSMLRYLCAAAFARKYIEIFIQKIEEKEEFNPQTVQILEECFKRSGTLVAYQLKLLKKNLPISELMKLTDNLRKKYRWFSIEWEKIEKLKIGFNPFTCAPHYRQIESAFFELSISQKDASISQIFQNCKTSPSYRYSLLATLAALFYLKQASKTFSFEENRVIQWIQKKATNFGLSNLFIATVEFLISAQMNTGYWKINQCSKMIDLYKMTSMIHVVCVVVAYSSEPVLKPLLSFLENVESLRNNHVIGTQSNELAYVLSTIKEKVTRYQCECGNIYLVGDCGGVQEISTCTDCKKAIGGQSYNIVPTSKRLDQSPGEGSKLAASTSEVGYMVTNFESVPLTYCVRSFSATSYRVMNFITHTLLAFGQQIKFANLQLINTTEEQVHGTINSCVESTKKLLNINDYDFCVCLNAMISKIPKFSEESGLPIVLSTNQDRVAWEEKFETKLLRPSIQNIGKFHTEFLSSLLDETNTSTIESQVEETYVPPKDMMLLENLFRITEVSSWENLRAVFFASPENIQQHPFLDLFFKQLEENIPLIPHLYPIISFTNMLIQKLSYRITRKNALEITIKRYLEEEDSNSLKLACEEFIIGWNAVCKFVTRFECENIQIPLLDMDSKLILCLPFRKDEGIYVCAMIEYLCELQNDMLDQALSIAANYPGSLQILEVENHVSCIKEIAVQYVVKNQLIQFSPEENDVALLHCYPNLQYGRGKQMIYNLVNVEKEISSVLLAGKVKLNHQDQKMKYMIFHLEAFNSGSSLLMDVNEKIKQQVYEGAFSISAVEASKLLPHLEYILSFLSKTGGGIRQTLKQYCVQHILDNSVLSMIESISSEVLSTELRFIVSVYEKVELASYEISVTCNLPSKYCKDEIEKSLKTTIEESLKKAPNTAPLLLKVLKRLIIRYLSSDEFNETHPLYLQLERDVLWDNFEIDEKLLNVVPQELELRHTYGLTLLLTDYIEEEERERMKKESSYLNETSKSTKKKTLKPITSKKKKLKSFI